MAGQLGKGGRRLSVNAFAGFSPDTSMYLGIYFDKNSGGTAITTVLDDEATLDDLKAYEAGGSTAGPWANGYARVRIDNKVGGEVAGEDTSSEDSSSGYHESTNENDITCFTTTGALSQTVLAGTRELAYFVISTQTTAQSSDTHHIIAFGPLTSPVTAFNVGDNFKILVGNADFRQS